MTEAIRFDGVHLDRGRTQVLRGVDWTVRAGERWVVLGPNGSGKTSMVMLAAAYDHPTRGTVRVLTHALGTVDVRALRLRIGLVSASVGKLLRPSLAAVDVVMSNRYGALEPWWHEYSEDDRLRARKLLDDAGFGHVADRGFGVLSEGERQQVQLARALMNEPELLLLDEPAAGLPHSEVETLIATVRRLRTDDDITVVIVEHHMGLIAALTDRVVVLDHGAKLMEGTAVEAQSDPRVIEAYIGKDAADDAA